jgi:pimeloyl-ACP methyl ester carboxylesterase
VGLEDLFTVVWWDQRGAGLSYRSDIPASTMTVEQFIADTLTVTDYLRERFDQDKIYLLGHSWGSFIGIQVAARAPERYRAYIGMAQMAHQLRSEMLAHAYMLAAYKDQGDMGMVRVLEKAPVTMIDGTPQAYLALRDKAMHRLGIGTTHDMGSVITGIFLPSWRFPEYTVGEKFHLWRGERSLGVSVFGSRSSALIWRGLAGNWTCRSTSSMGRTTSRVRTRWQRSTSARCGRR